MRGQASSSQARRSQGEAPDELPALRDDSSDEDEPVSGARIDGSPGTSDFFDASPGDPSLLFTFTAVDEDVTGGLRLAAPHARDAVARQASHARHLRRLWAS